jgi:ferredoxin
MIRITQQRIKCIGCGNCVEVAQNNWIMNDADGKADLIGAENNKGFYTIISSDDDYEPNFEAQQICPVKIIKVEKV